MKKETRSSKIFDKIKNAHEVKATVADQIEQVTQVLRDLSEISDKIPKLGLTDNTLKKISKKVLKDVNAIRYYLVADINRYEADVAFKK